MAIFISGVAGFIGGNLAAELLGRGERVLGFDNLSLGRIENLRPLRRQARFAFERVDLAEAGPYLTALRRFHRRHRITEVWHLAANSDIPAGLADAGIDLRNTFLTTFNTLETMKALAIPVIAFASSSAIYGDLKGALLTESTGPLFPISNYGAMKLASEAAVTAAAESHLERAFIFRFPNVIGAPATHGVILDFVRKLRATPRRLAVLGDGSQRKAYLHVDDLIGAMLHIRRRSRERISCFNIAGQDRGATVRFIAEAVVAALSPGAAIAYGRGGKGWVGDVPRFNYSTGKLQALGWRPRLGSREAIRRAIRQIIVQETGKNP